MTSSERGYRDVGRARTLGICLRERAYQLDMPFTALAKKAGLPYKTLMNYLGGKRTPDPFTLANIAAALETSPEALQTTRLLLPSVEPELFAARTRLYRSLPELWADDLLLISELVASLQARRSERGARVTLHPIAFDTMQRIYREAIPQIIREFSPVHLAAGYRSAGSGQVQFHISCAWSLKTNIAECRERIGNYLREKFKLGPRKLTITDAPDFDMQFNFPVGTNG